MLIGKATRLAQFLDKDQKEYDALVKFGYATDTGDRTGTRLEKDPAFEPKQITPDDLIRVISSFMGEIGRRHVEGERGYLLTCGVHRCEDDMITGIILRDAEGR